MGAIGAGLFLIAVGAIFTFAITADLSWVRLDVVGWVLMLVGAISFGIGLQMWRSRRRGTEIIQRRIYEEGDGGVLEEGDIIEERRTYDEPPQP
jgi:hypothetical protein